MSEGYAAKKEKGIEGIYYTVTGPGLRQYDRPITKEEHEAECIARSLALAHARGMEDKAAEIRKALGARKERQ